MLVVSMPTYRTPRHLLDRAVRSVLRQSYRKLRLVLVNDGGEPLHSLPRDRRLLVVNMEDNKGRYFCDAVVTEAIAHRPDVVWSVHDSDDWSEVERYENLLPQMKDGAVLSSYWRHQGSRKPILQKPLKARIERPQTGFVHISHWVSGLYTSERVQKAGGVHPGFRVGFDTLFVRMVAMTGKTAVVDQPDYHWCRRASGSLTTSPPTRFGSPARVAAKRQLAHLDELAWQNREDPGSVIRADVDELLKEQVAVEAAKLRDRLDA